jgi:hypothetical protein
MKRRSFALNLENTLCVKGDWVFTNRNALQKLPAASFFFQSTVFTSHNLSDSVHTSTWNQDNLSGLDKHIHQQLETPWLTFFKFTQTGI